jgi:hypothetical protein
MANGNPNEPNYPYSGGTDNPGDNTALAGGPSNFASTETGAPVLIETPVHLPPGLAATGSDTVLPAGVQAVPPSGAGFESGADYGEERSADSGFVEPDGRQAGQDETAGATETTSDKSPGAFPEPNP